MKILSGGSSTRGPKDLNDQMTSYKPAEPRVPLRAPLKGYGGI